MEYQTVQEEWGVLASLLPTRWRELAKETGAMRRSRGEIASPDVLLQVLMLHIGSGLSLKQAAARARIQGLANLSDVALMKRLRSSEAWLGELARQMFEESRFSMNSITLPTGRCIRAVDATTVEEPGATGTDWRVHYSLKLPELTCDFFEITDVRGAETYKRIPVLPGDIILGDRGYCHRQGVAHVVRQGGDVVVRLTSTGFPLMEPDTTLEFGLLEHMRMLNGNQPGHWRVQFVAEGKVWPARVCAIRKSHLAAELAKKKVLAAARKKHQEVRPATLEFAEYVMILTTIPAEVFSCDEVLSLYRSRWQIELCFKRLKSLLQLGHLPKRSDSSARAWIQGKLLTVLLIERLITEACSISPWGFSLYAKEPLARVLGSA